MKICIENAHILRVCSAFLDTLSFTLTLNLKSRGLSNDLAETTGHRVIFSQLGESSFFNFCIVVRFVTMQFVIINDFGEQPADVIKDCLLHQSKLYCRQGHLIKITLQ